MNNHPKKIFIFAGEPSGDLHGSRLACILKEKAEGICLIGVAGPKMRQQGVQGPLKMEDFEVMGFTDVIKAFPKLYKHFKLILHSILTSKPDAVVFIDYPGFNLRMAKALRKKGFQGKLIHYISPSVWAWGKHRIMEMEKTLDLLLTIYPFEKPHFSESTLEVNFVGSPLKEYMNEYTYHPNWKQITGISNTSRLIALFPGSRKAEIARNLPIILEAAALLKESNPSVIFGISSFDEATKHLYKSMIHRFPILNESVHLVSKKFSYELMRDSHCAIAKSGTVTLELALHKCPTIVVYKLSLLNRLYAKYILNVNLPYYCIVNILADREVFPELIENGLNPQNLSRQMQSFIHEGQKRIDCIQACEEIHKNLGNGKANTQAAESILRCLQC